MFIAGYTSEGVKGVTIEIVAESNNRKAIIYKVRWNKFTTTIKVINIKGPNPHHE